MACEALRMSAATSAIAAPPAAPAPAGVAPRALRNATTPAQANDKINSLYLSFLCRAPSSAESSKAIEALKNGLSLSDISWVLLNSREFLFIP